jgi:hypothetical protein
LWIKDLRPHHLRRKGTRPLSEPGFAIEQVSLVTGQKAWKMQRRDTHMKSETLHQFARRG